MAAATATQEGSTTVDNMHNCMVPPLPVATVTATQAASTAADSAHMHNCMFPPVPVATVTATQAASTAVGRTNLELKKERKPPRFKLEKVMACRSAGESLPKFTQRYRAVNTSTREYRCISVL